MTELVDNQIAVLIAEGLRLAQADGSLPAFDVPNIVVERSRRSTLDPVET